MKSKNKLFIFLIVLLLIPFFVNATSEKYEANLPLAKTVRGETKHILYYDHYSGSVYEYNIKNNTYEEIIVTDKPGFMAYAVDNYIYIWHDTYYWSYNPPKEEKEDDISEISCYNLTTHKLEFNYRIEEGIPSLIPSGKFIANHKQEVILISKNGYKTDDGTQIRYVYQFDKTGEKIGTAHYIEHAGDEGSSFISITPDDEFLLQTSGVYASGFHYLENGNINGHTFEVGTIKGAQNWSFISNDIAIDGGTIALFTRKSITDPNTKKPTKIISFKYVNNVYDGEYYSYAPSYYNDTKSVFVSNGQGAIIEYDKTTFKRIGYLNVEDNANIMRIDKDDKYFYVLYSHSDKKYIKKISINERQPQKQININNHTALNHSLNEIKIKYQKSKATFDYTQSIYKKNPNYNAPYFEGVLKDEVINDTLNQLNFYRWLSGMNTLEINKSKMARSQKGAFIQDLNKDLSHFPKQPTGMSSEFYSEAKKGTGAGGKEGDTYSGNVSYNARMYETPLEYIDDTNNIFKNVGHRSSMLDPYANAVSFGQSGPYNATSIYYDYTNDNPDVYYSYPTPGFFPYNGLTAPAYWSIFISPTYQPTTNTTITLTHNSKTYTIDSNKLYFDRIDRTLFYKVPEELKKLITKNNQYAKNETVNVSINNLEERYTATYATINYHTTFVDLEEEIIPLKGDLNNNGKVDLTDVLVELKIYFKNITPSSYQSKVGDMNNKDGINLTDVLMLLKVYFNNR